MSTLYDQAGRILGEMLDRHVGLKSAIYSGDTKPSQYRAIYALVTETLKYHALLTKLIALAGLDSIATQRRGQRVVIVMVYDLLFGKGSIGGGGSLRRVVLAATDRLRELLDREKADRNLERNVDLLPAAYRDQRRPPRYVRVNILKAAIDSVVDCIKSVVGGDKAEFIEDEHIPGLIRLPAALELHDHDLVVSAHAILQDKASCFPACVLLDTDRPLRHVIDACSAPGNKTLQLAAGVKGIVTAFERDPKRFATLCRRLMRAGAGNIVETFCADFRTSSPSDGHFADVDAILIDPSCSG